MKTINIWFKHEFGDSYKWMLIEDLYDDILHKDKQWHFFWEGPFIHIRCSKKFADKVVKYAKEVSFVAVVYEPVDWIDDQEIVDEYRWYFERQFHNNSVLAIEIYRNKGFPTHKELYLLFDRVAHCLVNSWFHIEKEAAETRSMQPYELALVGEYAMLRARFQGRYEYSAELANERRKRASKESTS